MSWDWEPLVTGHLRVNLPQDVQLEEVGGLLDSLGADFEGLEVHRANPRLVVVGGPGSDAIVITIEFWQALLAGALIAYGKRVLEHLADDSHEGVRKGLVMLADRLRRRRKATRGAESPATLIVELRGASDESARLSLALAFEVDLTTLAELEESLRAALELEFEEPIAGFAFQRHWTWDAESLRWKQTVYDQPDTVVVDAGDK